ncbi:MAG: hypothetical protein OXI17_10045 [Gammaproteobacteria bacterium]|nr:hypothetical protein [Gammaproteobacteria bacterium]
MSRTNWKHYAARIARAIERYGAEVTITQREKSVEPIPGTVIGDTVAERTGTFWAIWGKTLGRFRTESMVHTGQDVLFVAAGEFEPKPVHEVTMSGKTYFIEEVETVQADGETALLYKCKLRT